MVFLVVKAGLGNGFSVVSPALGSSCDVRCPPQPLHSVGFLYKNRTFAATGVNRGKCRGNALGKGEQTGCDLDRKYDARREKVRLCTVVTHRSGYLLLLLILAMSLIVNKPLENKF